jgi:hypothetical protein
MLERFEGSDGKRRLIEVLTAAPLVKQDRVLAEKLADLGQLLQFKSGEPIIKQEEFDNDVYFIIAGELDVTVNGRHVATRKAGDAVGEMVIAEPSKPRSATLKAIGDVLVLKVTEPDFNSLAEEHTHLEIDRDRGARSSPGKGGVPCDAKRLPLALHRLLDRKRSYRRSDPIEIETRQDRGADLDGWSI